MATEGQPMNESQSLSVGQTAQISKEITAADISLFAAVTGDFNPVHFDPAYAAGTFFKERIAHGMIAAGLISGVIGMKLPGPGTVYVQQTLNFLAPIRINDVVTVKVEVIELLEKNRVRLRTTVVNKDGVTAVDGEALVAVPKKR
jgi:3-hydroxybutyryl-CoA dehydratase